MSARKILTPKQKIAVLREHLIEKVPVSEICDKHDISLVNFYKWQKQLFENGAIAPPLTVINVSVRVRHMAAAGPGRIFFRARACARIELAVGESLSSRYTADSVRLAELA